MDEYGWVEKIELGQFSNKALVLVSRFARVLKQVNGQILSLRDPMLTKKILLHMRSNDDPRLRAEFESLLIEFKAMEKNNDSRINVPISNENQPHSEAQTNKSQTTDRGITLE